MGQVVAVLDALAKASVRGLIGSVNTRLDDLQDTVNTRTSNLQHLDFPEDLFRDIPAHNDVAAHTGVLADRGWLHARGDRGDLDDCYCSDYAA